MEDDRAQMVIADLLYNVRIASIVGSGAIRQVEFPMASGEMSSLEFIEFLKRVLTELVRFSIEGVDKRPFHGLAA
jgi:hypothetical protein